MNLDHLSLAVRARGMPELYDLALLWTRRHAGDLALLGAIGAAPWIALDWWLLGGRPPDEWYALYPLWLLVSLQVPLATAPITAYLGEAMFSRRPSKRSALKLALRSAWLLAVFGAMRGAMALPVLTLVLYPVHAVEALLLERQPLGATVRRSFVLANAWRGEYTLHLIVAAVVVPLTVAVAVWTVATLVSLLVWSQSLPERFLEWLNPGAHVLPIVMLFAVSGFLAVVRFLAYIDLRTRREGWDVEIELRRAGRALVPAGEP